MKRFIIAFIIFISLISSTVLSFPAIKATAQSPYLRVITNDTPFYSNVTDEKPLFYLPYTYYVKVIRESAGFYYVEYCGENGSICIDGFIPKDLLFDDGLSANSRYPNVSVLTADTAVLYSDSELQQIEQYVFSNRVLCYYGQTIATDGEIIYFVSYNNRLGYVRESEVIPFTIPNHPNPLTFIPEPTPDPPEVQQPSDSTSQTTANLRLIIIACMIFAGVVALFLVTKSRPSKNNSSYFEENEYE